MFSKKMTDKSMSSYSGQLDQIKTQIEQADAVILGAGAGLSTSAGYVYDGARFAQYFSDFGKKYGFSDMYSGGFYPYRTPEEHWAYWSRYIYINRYMDAPKPVYGQLYELVKEKDYFVLTTNVDHCFQKAGFDKHRLFYTQGDYGLFQCSRPCHETTYDNEDVIRQMVQAQGYVTGADGALTVPDGITPDMAVPTQLVPHCPKCGAAMSMNLRADHTFVEDEGWHMASERYAQFLRRHKDVKTLFLELGVGYNTPGIIKYPFWQYTYRWSDAFYVCINRGQADAPSEIRAKSVCLDADIAQAVADLGGC